MAVRTTYWVRVYPPPDAPPPPGKFQAPQGEYRVRAASEGEALAEGVRRYVSAHPRYKGLNFETHVTPVGEDVIVKQLRADVKAVEGQLGHNPDHGILFTLGIRGSGSARVSEVQSVLFPKDRYTVSAAKQWLHAHGKKAPAPDPGYERAEYYRFRQSPPGRYHSFSTIPAGKRNPESRGAVFESGVDFGREAASQFHSARTPQGKRELLLSNMRRHRELLDEYSQGFMQGWRQVSLTYARVGEGRFTEMGNPGVTMTRELAWAAATDAANRQMRAGGRAAWSEDDYNAAVETFNRLWPRPGGRPQRYARHLATGSYYDIVDTETGDVVRRVKTASAAMQVVASMNAKDVARRGNPQSAADLYEQFHGQPPSETLEYHDTIHDPGELAALGDLTEIKVATMSGLDATLSFEADPPKLTSTPDGRQLYFQGGDQTLDLAAIKMNGEKWRKDSMVIGVLYELTYRSKKSFDRFVLSDYFHKLGEETGDQPMLIYDTLNELLTVSGGQYEIKKEGIIN